MTSLTKLKRKLKGMAQKGHVIKQKILNYFFITSLKLGEFDKADFWLKLGASIEGIEGINNYLIESPLLQAASFQMPLITYDISRRTGLFQDLINREDEIPTMMADYLLKRGANVNARNKSGTTPLLRATDLHRLDLIKLLIDSGADVDAKDNSGTMPLHIATLFSTQEIIELLIDGGADVNAKDNEGRTPLLIATERNNLDIIDILIKNGADPENQKVLNYIEKSLKKYRIDKNNLDESFRFDRIDINEYNQENAGLKNDYQGIFKLSQLLAEKKAAYACVAFQQGFKSSSCLVSILCPDILKEIYSYILPSSLTEQSRKNKETLFKNIFNAGNHSIRFFKSKVSLNHASDKELNESQNDVSELRLKAGSGLTR